VRELRDAINRWVVEEGKVCLRDLVDGDARQPTANGGYLSALVKQRLDEALRDTRSVESLMEFVKDYEREVKSAANAWYRERNPSDDTLNILFPGKNAVALRNKLNSWRKR
jgi:hypothetical protein